MAWHGMTWSGLCCGMVWYVMAWSDMVWYGMTWYAIPWYDMTWYGMPWYDMAWLGHDMTCYGMI